MIKVVYYYNKEKKECPVRTYLLGYSIQKIKDVKVLSDIKKKIEYVSNNDGRAIEPLSKPLKGYCFFEIKHKRDSRKLIRICYFCHDNQMILLHAFEKPRVYHNKGDKDKVDKQFEIANLYMKDFIKLKLYEEYK